MGIVALKGIVIHGKIGVLPEERLVGRKFYVDIEVKASLKEVSRTDDIHDVLNYKMLNDAVQKCMQKEYKLLEAAARSIGEEILQQAGEVKEMKIRISKLSPLMKGNIHSAMIEWDYPEDY